MSIVTSSSSSEEDATNHPIEKGNVCHENKFGEVSFADRSSLATISVIAEKG